MSLATPTLEYRRTGFRKPPAPYKSLDAVANSCLGLYRRRKSVAESLKADSETIDQLAPEWREITDSVLRGRLANFRETFRRGGRAARAALMPAFAAIREAASRTTGMYPYTVQLMGALALERGHLAEMATGEGKTLTAGLAAVVAGWTGRPCHIVTVNDYLVERDAQGLASLYQFCGVKVGCVTAGMDPDARRRGYAADVTYVTSKEMLADFLRDRLQLGPLKDPTRRTIRQLLAPKSAATHTVMRGLWSAIVDEADSVLIDEAVTPLIISQQKENPLLVEAARVGAKIAGEMERGRHYTADLRYKEVELTEEGEAHVARIASRFPGLWSGRERRKEILVQALGAREFFHPGKQYVVEKGKVVIVDEFTGRPMPQRTWREGMHQAIEAREGLEISPPSETVARLSFQRFFRCFNRLSGMTGTAREASAEFWQVYGLPVVKIPTHRPMIRKQYPDRSFATETEKWAAIEQEISKMHATGRPVLVGTRSVEGSERLARGLRDLGLDCHVLNAVRLRDEAAIIAMAGQEGRITIATNMAGRGTDIKLGYGVAAKGGLHVIATERHESGRVDRQLFGRAGRQGDAGSAQAFVSAGDELLKRYLPKPLRNALGKALRERLSSGETLSRLAFSVAQRRAQYVALRQRQGVLRADLQIAEGLSFAGVDGL